MSNRKIYYFFIILLFSFLIVGCNKIETPFSLNDSYYKNGEFITIKKDKFKELVKEKENFIVFIYQPYCVTSQNFEKLLNNFIKDYQVSIYKMSFSEMKETFLKDEIKYYPSFAIFFNGEIVDYLDAEAEEDILYYKDLDKFTSWLTSYVKIPKKEINTGEFFEDDQTNNNNVVNNNKIDIIVDNLEYDEEKINIYFFWGDGCEHCEREFSFFKSIEKEYGDLYTLNTFEVWYNETNQEILKQFSSRMGDNVNGVPYTIIGNKSFSGFKDAYKKQFLDLIQNHHKNSDDVYFK